MTPYGVVIVVSRRMYKSCSTEPRIEAIQRNSKDIHQHHNFDERGSQEAYDMDDPNMDGLFNDESNLSSDLKLSYLNELDPIMVSDWREVDDTKIYVEASKADGDMKRALISETNIIKQTVRKYFKLTDTQTPSQKQFFLAFFGEDSAMTKVLMSTLDIDYPSILVFINTRCTLSIFRMSLSSFHNINVMTNPSLVVSADCFENF